MIITVPLLVLIYTGVLCLLYSKEQDKTNLLKILRNSPINDSPKRNENKNKDALPS